MKKIDWGLVLCYMLGRHKKRKLPWGIEICDRQHLDGRCPWWTTWNGEGASMIANARTPRRSQSQQREGQQ